MTKADAIKLFGLDVPTVKGFISVDENGNIFSNGTFHTVYIQQVDTENPLATGAKFGLDSALVKKALSWAAADTEVMIVPPTEGNTKLRMSVGKTKVQIATAAIQSDCEAVVQSIPQGEWKQFNPATLNAMKICMQTTKDNPMKYAFIRLSKEEVCSFIGNSCTRIQIDDCGVEDSILIHHSCLSAIPEGDCEFAVEERKLWFNQDNVWIGISLGEGAFPQEMIDKSLDLEGSIASFAMPAELSGAARMAGSFAGKDSPLILQFRGQNCVMRSEDNSFTTTIKIPDGKTLDITVELPIESLALATNVGGSMVLFSNRMVVVSEDKSIYRILTYRSVE